MSQPAVDPERVKRVADEFRARGCYVTVDGRVREQDAAEHLFGCKVSRLRALRTEGRGPPWVKPMKAVFYPIAEGLAWIDRSTGLADDT